MSANYSFVPATTTFTSTGTATDTNTLTIGGKVYTVQTSLTNVDGNILIGADAAATCQNIYDAVNLTGTAGTQYATAMTANTRVKATAVTATTVVFKALTPGEVGNLIATTDTVTNFAFTSTVMVNGAGNFTAWVAALEAGTQINSEVLSALHALTATAD